MIILITSLISCHLELSIYTLLPIFHIMALVGRNDADVVVLHLREVFAKRDTSDVSRKVLQRDQLQEGSLSEHHSNSYGDVEIIGARATISSNSAVGNDGNDGLASDRCVSL